MRDRSDAPDEDESRRPQLLALALIAALLIAAFLVFISRSGDDKNPGSGASASATATPSGTGNSSGSAPTAPEEAPRDVPVDDSAAYQQVLDDLGAFVMVYYRIEPGDTSGDRLARFDAAGLPVAPGLREVLNFSISADAELDLAPFDGSQALEASLTGEHSVTDYYGDGSLLSVVAPVRAVQTDRQGNKVGSLFVMTGSNWSKEGDGYVLTGFNDTYQQPGG